MNRTWSCILLAALVACGGDDKEARRKPAVPVTVVQAAEVVTGEVSDALLASATIEAEAMADLSPVASGMVIEVARDVGDKVRKGELLAVIENANLDASQQVTASEVRSIGQRLEEMERLFAQGAVSSRDLEDLRQQFTTSQIRAQEASRSAGETRLVAPFTGVVAARDVKVGELASSAKRAFQVVDLSTLRVRAKLPERDLGRVRVGQTARLVSAYDEARTATATVTRISPVVEVTSGTFEVLLTVDPSQDALRPGQYVSVELQVDRHEGVVVIPRDAIVWDHGQPVAFRMEPAPPEPVDTDTTEEEEPEADDTDKKPEVDTGPRLIARRVELALGLMDARSAEVTSGLTLGDRIIVIGQMGLKDGARVREPAPAEATGAAEPEPKGTSADEG